MGPEPWLSPAPNPDDISAQKPVVVFEVLDTSFRLNALLPTHGRRRCPGSLYDRGHQLRY
jgi:hypothetical protein